jgi:hypothetical protein
MSRIFHFAAGVSKDIMAECPESEKIKYVGIGASVYFTTLMAGLSAYFAFQLIFQHIFISVLLSLLWAGLIFNLDRFLVSSFRKKGNSVQEFLQALPRILMSIFIALVISKPLELKLFQSEIDFKLLEIKREKMLQIENLYSKKILQLDAKEKEYQKTIQNSFLLKEAYYAQYKCECDGTCGTGNSGRGRECLRKQQKYESYTKEHYDIQTRLNAKINSISKERLKINTEKETEKKQLTRFFSKGLLSRLEALSSLSGNTSFAILLLFIFLETAPILSKLFSPIGPYDHLLQGKEYPFKVAYMGQIRENKITEDLKTYSPVTIKTNTDKNLEKNSDEKIKQVDTANQLAQLQEKLVKQLLNRKSKNL